MPNKKIDVNGLEIVEQYQAYYPLDLSNPGCFKRNNEPVIIDIQLDEINIPPGTIRVVDANGDEISCQTFDQKLSNGYLESTNLIFLANIETISSTYYICIDDSIKENQDFGGIEQLEPELEDGVKRLDTGHYNLELCRGKADGTAAGKWGIRYFEAKSEGRNLIKNSGNAIGGFYGPFFTPENGKINPPEHTTVDVTTEVEGPLYVRYRFEGTVPAGLDPNLQDKDFEIIWEFFYDTPWFRREYIVDEYSTTIDGMRVSDNITVGDEFESGQENVVFSRFGTSNKTYYRSGDRYANILAREVNRLLQLPETEAPEGINSFKNEIEDDIMNVSWDYFWRLFCIKDDILEDEEIKEQAAKIMEEAHREVHHSDRKENVQSDKLVPVPEKEDQTIFPLNSDKTVEKNPETGYSMVWYTSNPVARYQIVQRPASGWVNWGTNGENEYPELPIGSTIYSGYAKFDDWESEAEKMQYNLEAKVRPIEKL
jgi:hypothetical protein